VQAVGNLLFDRPVAARTRFAIRFLRTTAGYCEQKADVMTGSRKPLTEVFEQLNGGDAGARARLIAIVYDEVRRTAARMMKNERRDHTLQPTALVHEAMLRLMGDEMIDQMPSHSHVRAALAGAMRHVLVDHARGRAARKRGRGLRRVSLDWVLEHFEGQDLEVLAVHEAIEELAALSARQAEVISLRFFGGMSMREIAEHLGVSLSTVENDFRLARAFLHASLKGTGI
jgi:RNA polymerase sigma-70 factor, ECF subfamily